MNNLLRKVEDVFRSYLSAELPSANVYCAMDQAFAGGGISVPAVIILARRSRPMSPALDATSAATNRYVSVSIYARTAPDHARETDGSVIQLARDHHDELAGAIADALHVDGLPALLNGVGVAGVGIDQVDLPQETISIEDRHLQTEYSFDVLAHSAS